MSKPTLEERVAAIEEAIMALLSTGAESVSPDFSNCPTPQQGSDDMLQQVLKSGNFVARHITNDGTRLPMDLRRIATPDPQEPYRLDTAPKTRMEEAGFNATSGESAWMKMPANAIPLHGDHHIMAIDPKASPKGIPFSVAIEYVKAGRMVRRPSWPPPDTLHLDGSLFNQPGLNKLCGIGKVDVEFNVHLANDWEVVPEPWSTIECPECHQQTEWPRMFPDGKQNPFCDKCGGKIGVP